MKSFHYENIIRSIEYMTIKIKHIQDISEGLIMRYKRIRGSKRKFRNIECLLSEATRQFPVNFPQHYATVLLPTNSGWVNALPLKGKKQLASLLIKSAMYLQKRKPISNIKIVVMFHIQNFWRSQIIVFEDAAVVDSFFDRDHDWQT